VAIAAQPPQQAAVDFARCLVPLWREMLGPELIGVYLIGSLAHGGFSARYSDVDIGIVVENGASQPTFDRVRSEAVALSPEWGPKLSVFWADRAFSLGRFPPLDRIDYLDHAVPLMERERVQPPRPALDDVRRYLGGAPFANWVEQVRRFSAADALDPKDRKIYLRTLLYPGRFCFSWTTGRMDSNDEAVAFLEKTRPTGIDVALVARALRSRQADADPDPLFSARTMLPAQVEGCAALIAR
jgi:hypothetical protein